jgi:hypothetical protein
MAELTQRQMASMGGRALAAKQTSAERSARCRRAVTIRWANYRTARKAAKKEKL